MDSLKVIKEIISNPMLKSNMSLQMQLGLPYLEKKNDKLCMSFKPHIEAPVFTNIEYYEPQYELELVYPFKKIIKFVNLNFERSINNTEPVAKVDIKELASSGKTVLNELYAACTRVLEFQEQDGKVSDVSIKKYQKVYFETVEKLGLTAVYGSIEK